MTRTVLLFVALCLAAGAGFVGRCSGPRPSVAATRLAPLAQGYRATATCGTAEARARSR